MLFVAHYHVNYPSRTIVQSHLFRVNFHCIKYSHCVVGGGLYFCEHEDVITQNPFYIHGTIPSRDYKKKKQTGKNFIFTEQFCRFSRNFNLTKSFLFTTKSLNLKVITGNYTVYNMLLSIHK